MNYCNIKKFDIANGEGIRTTLFVSGCRNRCKNCFQPETWSFDYGEPFTKEVEDEILETFKIPSVRGLTLLGGEPMEPSNQSALAPFLRRFREKFGAAKTLWIYTGCTLEQLKDPASRWRTDVTDEILSMTDVLVDGPFIEELKDISLQFRGSSNQRIIHLTEQNVEGIPGTVALKPFK